MRTGMRSALLVGAAILTLAGSAARADLAGASVAGILEFPGYNGNYFDPVVGQVPPGYGNSSGPTVVLSGTGSGNFAWLQGGGTVEDPVIDSWLAEFDGLQLKVTFRNQYYYGTLSGSKLTFRSDAFIGRSLERIGADAFLGSGNGPMTATLVGDTIVLSVAPGCGPCAWVPAVYSNTYVLSSGSLLAGLTLKSAVVAGCKNVTGTVSLASPAPAGGLVVSLQDTLAAAITPATVRIPEGGVSKSFTIKTVAVAASQDGTVSATFGGATRTQPLTLRPMGLTSLALSPASLAGGQPVAGTARLECKAGPGPVTVTLASSNAAVAGPIAPQIVVPQGVQSASFDVQTSAVLAKTSLRISGTANDIARSRTLTVTPAAAVTPTSLRFGSVAVGTTSAPLTATLVNNGTAAIAIDSIVLFGTYASWFTQSSACPASLPPGSSCTIAVRFVPPSAAGHSAYLKIATSATSTPLSVTLSGTGT